MERSVRNASWEKLFLDMKVRFARRLVNGFQIECSRPICRPVNARAYG